MRTYRVRLDGRARRAPGRPAARPARVGGRGRRSSCSSPPRPAGGGAPGTPTRPRPARWWPCFPSRPRRAPTRAWSSWRTDWPPGSWTSCRSRGSGSCWAAVRASPTATGRTRARALGQEQGATFVVEGTLEQSAERLRASAELIDAATGRAALVRALRPALRRLGRGAGRARRAHRQRGLRRRRLPGDPRPRLRATARRSRGPRARAPRPRAARKADEGGERQGPGAHRPGAGPRSPLQRRAVHPLPALPRAGRSRDTRRKPKPWRAGARRCASWSTSTPTTLGGAWSSASWYAYSDKRDDAGPWRSSTARSSWPRTIRASSRRSPSSCPGTASRTRRRAARPGRALRPRDALRLAPVPGRLLPRPLSRHRRPDRGFHRIRPLGPPLRDAQPRPARRRGRDGAVARAASSRAGRTTRGSCRCSESGDFSPAATAERALWLDSLAKAGLPKCATPEQIAALKIKRSARVRGRAARMAAPRT